ncbi:MAG: hypothetical protein ACE5EV_02340, partial [Gaiellales bacterium]
AGQGPRNARRTRSVAHPTRLQLLHGRDEPPAGLRELRAGPVTAQLEGVDLRYVRLGPTELVRRLYVAVRDESWGTVPGDVSSLELDDRGDSFRLAFESSHRAGELDFRWRGTIVGERDGTITARMEGVAGADFAYNRIGLCVLHPPRENAGRPYRAETPDGSIGDTLPDLIAHQALEKGFLVPILPSYTALAIELEDGELRFDFEGDLFEMEDQRNWTDGSFKTYSTPLALGFPHAARAGQQIDQRVTISPPSSPAGGATHSRDASARVVLAVDSGTGATLPRLGLGAASDGLPLSDRETDALRLLELDHLRVDARLSDPTYADAVRRVIGEASSLGCALELAVAAGDDDASKLAELASLLAGARVARVLVFGDGARTNTPEETSPPALVELVREQLAPALPGGTDMYFCNLNRTRPLIEAMDGVYWSINPQVHAFDDRSLMETCEAQADTVRTARSFCGDLPLIVSAVTLLPRWNPYAVGPAPEPASGRLPPEVDPRQASQLGAAWTLASIKYLAEAGAASITYYETVGWRGVLEREAGSPEPELFPSAPGEPFPLYRVLAELARFRGAEVVTCRSSDPLVAVGLALGQGGAATILVANMTAEAQTVEVEGGGRLALEGYGVGASTLDGA